MGFDYAIAVEFVELEGWDVVYGGFEYDRAAVCCA
jgi:hypothetical protein